MEVTREAARRIRRRTGELYLWLEPVGGAWVSDELDYVRPERIEFRAYHDAGIDVFVATNIKARLLRVVPRFWPLRGIKAFVDGKRWGARGRVGGETALDFTGAGPP
ncbi:MAG: hypothetical protein ACRDNB_00230 [Gaiellaceae bacterium]